MSEGKSGNLPDKGIPKSDNQQNGNTLSVNVDTLNYQANDIAELRKLADNHPELAQQIINDRRHESEMAENSYRLGVVLTSILAIVILGVASWTLINLGWWQSIMFVAAMLGISHILRVILKGEFSETSWFGKILTNKPKE